MLPGDITTVMVFTLAVLSSLATLLLPWTSYYIILLGTEYLKCLSAKTRMEQGAQGSGSYTIPGDI